MPAPDRVLIPYEPREEGRFDLVGAYGDDGCQFMAFVTGAFPADGWSGKYPPLFLRANWTRFTRWYAVLHRFDADGGHLGTDAWSGGTTAEGREEATCRAQDRLNELLASLGPYRLCDIRVKTFRVEIDGYLFGLIYRPETMDDPDDPEATPEYVMLEPNDIMFHPPYDSGEFST